MAETKFYPPSNDFIFKALMLRNPEILQDFLRCVLPGIETDLESLKAGNSELLAIHKSGKNVRLDLNLVSSKGELINVEVQVAHEQGLENRMQYYMARNYVNQILSGDGYVKARRVISIWICAFRFKDDGACFRDYVLHDIKNGDVLPESMELVILDAPNYQKASAELQPWLQFFAAKTEDEIMSLALQSPQMEIPCELVRRMNMSPSERILADVAEREWIDRAILRGAAFEAGEIKGRNEGRNEGRDEERLSMARLMLQDGEPRSKILKFTKLTEEELDNLQQG